MKRHCVLYFYLTNDWKESETNALCLKCLREFQHNYSSVKIYLSISNECTVNASKDIIDWIIKNITIQKDIIPIQNNKALCETSVYYPILIGENDAISSYGDDDIVFMCHAKGYTNMTDNRFKNKDAILNWVGGMWWFNNHDVSEIDSLFENPDIISVGMFLVKYGFNFNKYNWHYSGTLFWINPKKLDKYIKGHNIEIPPFKNRYWSEQFLGNIYPIDHAGTTGVVFDWNTNRFDGYRLTNVPNWKEYIKPNIISDYNKWFENLKQKNL